MQINSKSIKKHFEKSMDKYNENALVQADMANQLVQEVLKYRNNFDKILELGCGTGLLTEKVKEKIIFKNYYANDIVEKSKNYISKILPNSEFIHGNAQRIKPPADIDLIISNAMFQWFVNLEPVITYYKNFLEKDGILAFSTFGPKNFYELKDISGLALNYLTSEDVKAILTKNFDILYCHEYTETLEFETPLALLAHMKNTGVNSLTSKTWTVKEVKSFCEKYMEKFEKTKLTYNPIIVIAKIK